MKILAGAVIAFALCVAAVAGDVLDQESPVEPFPFGNTGFNASADILVWQQEVTVGVAGRLSRIELFANSAGSATIGINLGAPWQTDANDFETTMLVGAGQVRTWVSIDMSASGLSFDVGDKFVIFIQGNNDGLGLIGSSFAPNGSYTAGRLWVNLPAPPRPTSNGEADFGFRTFVDDSPPGRLGDLNCDGSIDALDIEPFLVALFEPENYPQRFPDCDINLADINGDGEINALDIEPFLGVLFP